MLLSSAYRTKRCPRRSSSRSRSSSTRLLSSGESTPRTQKVTSAVSNIIWGIRVLRAASIRRSRRHGNAVADDDRVIANEHFPDHQAYNALPLDDVKRVRGFTEPREKCRQRFREMQVRRSFSGLFGNRLQLHSQRTLALPQ